MYKVEEFVARHAASRRAGQFLAGLSRKIVIPALLGLGAITASAQSLVPVNDNFANAQIISGPSGSVRGNDVNATAEAGEPSHNGVGATNSIWFSWTAPSSAWYTFDTRGSTDKLGVNLNTILGIYTNPPVDQLGAVGTTSNTGNPNDDDPSEVANGISNTISRVDFLASGGTTYYIAIDSADGFAPGEVVLNWNSAPNSGTFAWASGVQTGQIIYVGGSSTAADQNVPTTGRRSAGSFPTRLMYLTGDNDQTNTVTITRKGGFTGRVHVQYEVTSTIYTNIYQTNIIVTNISMATYLTTNTNSSGVFVATPNDVVVSYTNLFLTNMFFQNRFMDNLHGNIVYDQDFGSVTVAITNVLTPNRPRPTITGSTNLQSCVNTLPKVCLDQSDITNGVPDTNGVYTIASTNVICNLDTPIIAFQYVDSVVGGEVDPDNFVPNYVPEYPTGTNEMVFDDFQMSASAPVNLTDVFFEQPDYSFFDPLADYSHYGVNRTFVLNITNVYMDALESPDIVPPTIDPVDGSASINLRQTDVMTPNISACETNTVFNWEYARYQVGEGGEPTPVHGIQGASGIWIQIWNAPQGGASVQYRINWLPNPNSYDNYHTYPLEPGSDYGKPGIDCAEIIGSVSVPFGGNWLAGIPLPRPFASNDTLVEFNEDIRLQLFNPQPNQTASPPGILGSQSEATVTIKFNQQPAGAVDRGHNPDFSPSSYPSFNPVPGANGPVYGVAVQGDDQSVIVGDFTAFDTVPYNRIARLTTSGLPDFNFDPGDGANGFITSAAIDSNGKIVIGGGFTSFNGTTLYHLARLSQTGAVDTSFKPGFGADATIWATTLQPDGKILIGGEFSSYDATNRNAIARINADGSLDTSFAQSSGPNDTVFAITVQPDGKVVIGGQFTKVNGVPQAHIARLNTDGSLDTNFNSGAGFDENIYAIAVQPDGKLVVGGAFSSYNNKGVGGIIRINADGSYDSSFDTGRGADSTVYAVKLQSDGAVLIGGRFNNFNDTRRVGVARLLANGWLDTSFMDTAYNQFAGLANHFHNELVYDVTDGYSPNNTRNFVFSIGLESSGDVMIGGGFQRVGGGGARDDIRDRYNVARLVGGSTPGPGNVLLTKSTYTVDENAGVKGAFMNLLRTNGTLGAVGVHFNTNFLAVGPGAATTNDFKLNSKNTAEPIYQIYWPATTTILPTQWGWMKSDGFYGPSESLVPTPNTKEPNIPLYLDITDNSLVDGNRAALLNLLQPDGTSTFALGGETIPLGVAFGNRDSRLQIIDNDYYAGTFGFSRPTYTVNRNGGSITITVVRTNASNGSVVVNFTTANGTALNTIDYVKTNGSLTFGSGVTSKTFDVRILNSFTAQPDKFFNVQLSFGSNPGNYGVMDTNVLATNSTVTIIDNNFSPGHLNFSSPIYSVGETAGSATIAVTRTGGSVGAITAQFFATGGTATNNLNFVATNGSLTWNNNDASIKTFQVPLIHDGIVTGDLSVNLSLTNAYIVADPTNPTKTNILGAISNAVLNVIDEDAAGRIGFIVPNFNVPESARAVRITVSRTGGVAGPATINYATTNLGPTNNPLFAQAFTNYSPASGQLNFAPGEFSKTFDVLLIDNDFQNPDKIFGVNLFNGNPSTITSNALTSATVTIIDDESQHTPAGQVDTTYVYPGFNDFVLSTALQPDGKLIAGGNFTMVNSYIRNHIARLNVEGSVDTDFGNNLSGANGNITAVLSQVPNANNSVSNSYINGPIVIAGAFDIVNNVFRHKIARLNIDGSLDTTFNPGAGADGVINALAQTFGGINQERKVLAVGAFGGFNGVPANGIIQLNDDGSVDGNFNTGIGVSGINGIVYAVAVQADRKIIIGGDFTMFNGVPHGHLARLNPDGSLDNTFNADTGTNGSVRAIAIQPDGKIVLGGMFTAVNGASAPHVARLNIDGTVDSSFNIGLGANDSVLALAIDSEGRILVGGSFTSASGVTRYRLTRLASDGTVDPSINFGAGADSFITTISLQTDDQIIVGGGFASFDNIPQGHIARLAGGSVRGDGQITFTATDYVVDENGTNAVITLRRIGGTESSVLPPSSVDFITLDGSAVAGVDYVGVTNTVLFARGETFATISVPIIDNTLVDGDRTVQLVLLRATNGLALGPQPFATLTIVNDDSGVSFGAAQYRVAENTPAGAALIPVLRSGSTLGTVSVDVATVGGTALPLINYVPATNTVVFGPGESNKLFRVQILNDGLVDGDQTVDLQLSNPQGGVLVSPNVATLTIAESSFGPGVLSFTQSNYTALQSSGNAIVTIQRTNGSTGPVSVTLSTGDGTASAGVDYQPMNVTVILADGEITKDVAIKILPHATVQPDKTFTVNLSNPQGGAVLANTSATVTILDDHMNFTLSSPAYFVRQDAGTVIVTVVRNSGTNGTVTVDYATTNAPATNGVAVAGEDYGATFGTLTFSPGEITKNIIIPILDDGQVGLDEQFTIALSNPGPNSFLGAPSVATITILNVHSGLGFSSPTYVVTEGQTNALITVNRSAINTGAVSVNFFTTDGTARAGVRYGATNGTLNFANGQATASFLVPIIDDNQVNGDQTVFLTLFNASTGATIVQSNAVLTIQDNDIGLRFSSPSYSVLKSNVAATITVQRTSVTNLPITVDFATQDGTATNGIQYFATNGTLTFLPGELTKTFDVRVIDNNTNVITGDKNFYVKLSNPGTNGVLVAPSTALVNIVEVHGSLVIGAGTALLSESGPVNGLIDANETVTMYFAFRNTGGGNTTNLVATLLNTNGVINATAAAPFGAANATSYGTLIENGPSVSRQFTFTANAASGQTIVATFLLQDVGSGHPLGTQTFTFGVGSQTFSFTNNQPITILDSTNPPTKASVYPSQINVQNVIGNVAKVTATFVGLNHSYPDDIDALLVGPNPGSGAPSTLLMAAVGGPFNLSNVRLTFDDSYPALPNEAPITTGTNRPTLGTAASEPSFYPTFPNNAPPGPYPISLGVFNGINPNGLWSLYLVDSTTLDSGSMTGGWILNVTTGSHLDQNVDLGISIANSPVPATVSNVVVYHVDFTNYGPAGATNIIVTDVLPPGVTYLSNNCDCAFSQTTNGLQFPLAVLLKDQHAYFDIYVRADVVGTFTNTVTVTCDNPDLNFPNNTASVLTEVDTPSADLAAQIAISPNPVLVNNNVTITMTAINNGFSPATGVMLTNQLPAGLSLQSVSSSVGTAVITTNTTGLVVAALGNLAVNPNPATSPTVTIVATATNAVTSLVTAKIGSSTFDPLKGNNTASAKVEVDAPPISFAVQQNGLLLSWPAAAGNLVVEQATSLAPPAVWTPVTDSSAVLVNGQYQVQVSSSNSARFFRLRAQ